MAKISKEQFDALINYINCRLEERLDDSLSADEGLTSTIAAISAKDELQQLWVEDEDEQD